MVEWKDPRIDPFSCSQFHPPSLICSPRSRSTMPWAPALRSDSRTLRRDFVLRCVYQVAHDLPADRRIRVQQPVKASMRFHLCLEKRLSLRKQTIGKLWCAEVSVTRTNTSPCQAPQSTSGDLKSSSPAVDLITCLRSQRIEHKPWPGRSVESPEIRRLRLIISACRRAARCWCQMSLPRAVRVAAVRVGRETSAGRSRTPRGESPARIRR